MNDPQSRPVWANKLDAAEIERRLTHYPPRTPAQVRQHEHLREQARLFGYTLAIGLPEGREKSLALTALEEALMWANAAIARSPEIPEEGG